MILIGEVRGILDYISSVTLLPLTGAFLECLHQSLQGEGRKLYGGIRFREDRACLRASIHEDG